MPTPIPGADAQSIMSKAARAARAAAVLNRPASSVPVFLASSVGSAIGVYALSASHFEAPLAVKVLLLLGFVGAIINAMDCWTTRRRLDAAIELLHLQNETSG